MLMLQTKCVTPSPLHPWSIFMLLMATGVADQLVLPPERGDCQDTLVHLSLPMFATLDLQFAI